MRSKPVWVFAVSKLQFSPDAQDDLLEIKRYITEVLSNPLAAENTLKKILQNIRMLEEQPYIGAPLSSIVRMDTHYRFLICGNYLAFYYVENEIVYIVRILYGKRDYCKILFGEQYGTH